MAFENVFEDRGVIARFTETIAKDDVMGAKSEAWGHPRWGYFDYELWDMTAVDAVEVTREDVFPIPYMDKAASNSTRRSKFALVFTHPDLREAADLYKRAVETLDFECRSFCTLDAARAWIDG